MIDRLVNIKILLLAALNYCKGPVHSFSFAEKEIKLALNVLDDLLKKLDEKLNMGDL